MHPKIAEVEPVNIPHSFVALGISMLLTTGPALARDCSTNWKRWGYISQPDCESVDTSPDAYLQQLQDSTEAWRALVRKLERQQMRDAEALRKSGEIAKSYQNYVEQHREEIERGNQELMDSARELSEKMQTK